MKANGRTSGKRRYTRTPNMEAAIGERAAARGELTNARRKNDPHAIAEAQQRVAAAEELMRAANEQQFQHIAGMRGNTAIRALQDLVQLVGQRRYPVKVEHQELIMGAIDQAREELAQAFNVAIARNARQPVICRAIIFGAAVVSRQH